MWGRGEEWGSGVSHLPPPPHQLTPDMVAEVCLGSAVPIRVTVKWFIDPSRAGGSEDTGAAPQADREGARLGDGLGKDGDHLDVGERQGQGGGAQMLEGWGMGPVGCQSFRSGQGPPGFQGRWRLALHSAL